MSESQDTTAPARFTREGTRHRFTARTGTVTAVSRPVEAYVRVTLTGPDFADFVSNGPGDHARVFFPNPATGEYLAPTPAGPGEDGIVRPDGPMFARDFTPLNVRRDPETGEVSVDLDFLRHQDPGPAAAWAEAAEVGDSIVVVGPRGSHGLPHGVRRVVIVADGSALPAAARWAAELPADVEIEVIADVPPADLEWVDEYLRLQGGREVLVSEVFGGLDDAVRDTGVDAETFVFGAGEASRLVPLRRFLKYELQLPREQYALSGYWKRGTVAFDHHAPIDPEDPDEE
ncbi:siderophore-interacting protein [Leucobacter iarius]|uniref:Siderophore-interacting protein n=1 Tax=Leucobacter iarius TaxID=333963 RepID=A0ABN2L848_9MICO